MRIAILFVVTIFVGLALRSEPAQLTQASNATPASGSLVGVRDGLRRGMPLSRAYEVAIRCIREAAGFKTKSNTRKVKLYRNEDPLSLLGITNPDRLNALRRYIIRNDEIGVQREYDTSTPWKRAFQPRRFIIERKSLDVIKTTSTFFDLVKTIQTKSGLPRLPLSTAAQIVADCRKYPDGGSPIAKPVPGEASETESLRDSCLREMRPVEECNEISAPKIKDDPEIVDRQQFAACIVVGEEYGITTAGLQTPEDEYANYYLKFALRDERPSADPVVSTIVANINANWTYEDLIQFIAENAQVNLPVETVARDIVVSNILRLNPAASFAFDSTIEKLVDRSTIQGNINSDLASSGIFLPASSAGVPNYEKALSARAPEKRQSVGRKSLSISPNDTVEMVVEKVADSIYTMEEN